MSFPGPCGTTISSTTARWILRPLIVVIRRRFPTLFGRGGNLRANWPIRSISFAEKKLSRRRLAIFRVRGKPLQYEPRILRIDLHEPVGLAQSGEATQSRCA